MKMSEMVELLTDDLSQRVVGGTVEVNVGTTKLGDSLFC